MKRKIFHVNGFLESVSESETQTFFDSISHKIKDFYPKTVECCIDGCDIVTLGYGFKGGEKIICKKHKDLVPGTVLLKKVCRFKECLKSGSIGVGRYKFCAEHVTEIKVLGLPKGCLIKKGWTPRCHHEGCMTVPSFDKNTKCREHAENLLSDDPRSCSIPGCISKRRPRFGVEGGKVMYCRDHGLELGMVDLCGGFCIHDGCKTRASFKKNKYTSAKYCARHRPDEYILNVKTCMSPGCESRPSFGPPGTSEYIYCDNHKLLGYVALGDSRCVRYGCNITASFGYKGEMTSLWCFKHKSEESVNMSDSTPSSTPSLNSSLNSTLTEDDLLFKETLDWIREDTKVWI